MWRSADLAYLALFTCVALALTVHSLALLILSLGSILVLGWRDATRNELSVGLDWSTITCLGLIVLLVIRIISYARQ